MYAFHLALKCGKKETASIAKRVVGGKDTKIADWPWVVSINATTNQGKKMYWMAGTILSENFILTARNGFGN